MAVVLWPKRRSTPDEGSAVGGQVASYDVAANGNVDVTALDGNSLRTAQSTSKRCTRPVRGAIGATLHTVVVAICHIQPITAIHGDPARGIKVTVVTA